MSQIDMKAMRDMVIELGLDNYADELEIGACSMCCLVANSGGGTPVTGGGC